MKSSQHCNIASDTMRVRRLMLAATCFTWVSLAAIAVTMRHQESSNAQLYITLSWWYVLTLMFYYSIYVVIQHGMANSLFLGSLPFILSVAGLYIVCTCGAFILVEYYHVRLRFHILTQLLLNSILGIAVVFAAVARIAAEDKLADASSDGGDTVEKPHPIESEARV